MQNAHTKEQLAEFLLSRLTADERTTSALLAQMFIEAVAEPQLGDPESLGRLGTMLGSFAIRKDDVDIFEWLRSALMAAAPTGFLLDPKSTTGAITAAIVGLACAIGKAIHDLHVKGAWLDSRSAHILLILKSNIPDTNHPGLTPQEIHSIVQRTDPGCDLALIQRTLDGLLFVPVRIGTRAFVVRDATERWRSLV